MSILKYDAEATTWSPQGKILQVDYAMEAVKQGSICLALRSSDAAVLVSVKKNPTRLATYQEKLFKVSNEAGIGISGMTADARILCKFMRNLNTEYQIKYNRNASVSYIAEKVSKKYQNKTNVSGKRPFGVGILLIGYTHDKEPKIFEFSPSGECLEYEAYAIGAKSQTAKTYLEKYVDHFNKNNVEELILQALKAVKAGYRDEKEEMTENNIEVSVLDKKHGYVSLKSEELKTYLDKLSTFNPEGRMLVE